MNLFEITNAAIRFKEYKNQQVVTFKDIDRIHKRAEGTARKAFNRNKKHFIENIDYFVITSKSPIYMLNALEVNVIPPKGITLITISGYIMMTKIFNDEISWEIQRKLYIYSQAKQNTEKEYCKEILMFIKDFAKSIHKDIDELKENSINKPLSPKTSFSGWTYKMFPKYQLLMEHFNIGRKELYHNLYLELQNRYQDINLKQMQEDFCFENGLDNCYTMDVIEHNKDLRFAFEQLVDDLLEKYKLLPHYKYKTIFTD